jgi:limonene-1,2-epoxide hydrolase
MSIRRRRVLTGGMAAAVLGFTARSGAQSSPLTVEEQANLKVVEDFVAAWNAKDVAKMTSFLAEDARFSAGPIGKFAPLRPARAILEPFLGRLAAVKMTVKPGSPAARGPMVTHERTDEMKTVDGSTSGSGTYFGVFGLRDRKIVDFIDFQISS